MQYSIFPIFLSFFVMGFIDIVGTLVGFASKHFEISSAMAGLLPFLCFFSFGLLSVPAGILAHKKGKKFVLLSGLVLSFIGFVIPMLKFDNYGFLLISILLIGAGATMMQVAGFPILKDVSGEGKYPRNFTFAQFIKAIASMAGPVLTAFVLSSWTNLFPLYSAIVAITFLLILSTKTEKTSVRQEQNRVSLGEIFNLLKNRYVLLMVFSIFLYVGAEVGINSWIAKYLSSTYNFDITKWGTLGIAFFFLSLMAGRLIGSMILNYLSAQKFFFICAIGGIVGVTGLFTGKIAIAFASIILIGFTFGNIFPLIFSILIDAMPDKSNELSGLMCMAVVGGAVTPLLMGVIADYSVMACFAIPLISFFFISFAAIVTLRKNPAENH
ncbi:MAG: MFS transporter [Oligoflexales bacterium]|nr:MFS transporter [Oligoflexales bacterium]